mgnify:CR=1 FL=1
MRKNKLPDHAPITIRQLAMLHVAKNKLDLTDEDYRSLLLLYGGVKSSKQLNQEGLRRVLDRFKELGFEPIQKKVFAAIEAYAKQAGADVVLDSANNPTLLYTNPSVERTQQLIDMLKK